MPGIQRYVVASHLLIGLLVWATLVKLLVAGAYALEIADPALIGGGFRLSTLLGLVLAGGAVVYSLRNQTARTYSNEVVAELMKVTWPDRKETQRSTVVVLVTSLIMAALMGLFDQVWGSITSLIYS